MSSDDVDDGSASDDWVVRRRAVRELALGGDPALLVPFLNDPHPRVAEEAIEALGHARHTPAVAELIECLNAKSHRVRAQAAYSLRSIGDPRAIEPLIALLDRLTDSWLQAAVANVLGAFGDERALPSLQRLTEADNDRVRNNALGAIFRIEHLEPAVQPPRQI
jgi:HEAT repeat protein